jgi:TRAP-type C4-dicarboxylate transport system permease small subunit
LKALGKINWTAAALGGFLLFFLSFLITVDVLVRWIFGRPFVGVFETSEVIFLVLTFMAAGLTQQAGRQMRVEILVSRLHGKPKDIVNVFADLLGLSFFSLLLWEGCSEWIDAWNGHFVRRGMIEIPNTIHLGFLVIGSLLLCLNFLRGILAGLRRASSAPEIADSGSRT